MRAIALTTDNPPAGHLAAMSDPALENLLDSFLGYLSEEGWVEALAAVVAAKKEEGSSGLAPRAQGLNC